MKAYSSRPSSRPSRALSRAARAVILLLGLLLPQMLQLWPSLAGRSVFLPVDVLNLPEVYSPDVRPRAHDELMSDPVVAFEVWRQFTVAEVRAGRLPLWNPHGYAGYPHLAANQTAVFSPYRLIDYAWPGPEALAWTQVARSVVAGAGIYVFLRRAVRLRSAAALVGAWGWPLAGFLSLWAYFPHGAVVTWLGWAMLAVDRTIRRPGSWWGAGLAVVSALAWLSGHAAMAGQVVLATAPWGLFVTFRLWRAHGPRGAFAGVSAAAAAGVLGLTLSMPQTLPTIEYLRDSARVMNRLGGRVEAETSGVKGLAQLAFPFSLGSTRLYAIYGGKMNLPESPAAGHAGTVALLALVPMSFLHRRRRSAVCLFAAVGVLSVLPSLGIPGLGSLLAMPPLSLLHHTRWTFLTAFAVLILASIGTDHALRGVRRAAYLQALGIMFCLFALAAFAWQAYRLPAWAEARYAKIAATLAANRTDAAFVEPADIDRSRSVMRRYFAWSAFTAALAAGAWAYAGRVRSGRLGAYAFSVVAAGELLATFWGHAAQPDRSLYYPRVPALEAIAGRDAGRVCGVNCLPANLAQSAGLADVRGYDAIDPGRYVELLERFRDPSSSRGQAYNSVQWFVPQWGSPLARMLGLRYWIARGNPPPGVTPSIRAKDYWVIIDPRAVPRAFVPRRVAAVDDDRERLALLARPNFDPAEVAYVETATPADLPTAPAAGKARITRDLPSRVTVEAEMESSGMLVLADLWDAGWVARVNGAAVPILRANHALRGVQLPAGTSTVEFSYEPASFRNGLWLAGVAAVGCVAWMIIPAAAARRRARSAPSTGPADRPA